MSSSPTEKTAGLEPATAGAVLVEMPKMGISVSEGTIVEWRRQPGDPVEADETIADVTTDKVDVEIPCPAAGVLARILVDAGTTVEVGTAIAEIDTVAAPPGGDADGAAGVAHQLNGAAEAAGETATPERDRSAFYSPIVRRIADKHGIDLERVEGTGIGGRVRKRDLLALIEHGEAGEQPLPALHSESPYRPEPVSPAAAANGSAAAAETPRERREPLSPMRKAIASHMLESRRTSAHCTTVVEVDMSRVMALRAQRREAAKRRGVHLTPLAFVAEAAVAALARYPILNSSIDGDQIVHHDDVNLGIAVALEQGLIVPVVERAQLLSVEGLAAAIGELAERARSKRLEPDEVHGGTFTITNPGQFGAVLATPIINQPQVAILDLEAIVKRPVVIEDAEGGDSLGIRPIANLCMSWDHRALDGAVAARFLGEVKQRLEHGDGQ